MGIGYGGRPPVVFIRVAGTALGLGRPAGVGALPHSHTSRRMARPLVARGVWPRLVLVRAAVLKA